MHSQPYQIASALSDATTWMCSPPDTLMRARRSDSDNGGHCSLRTIKRQRFDSASTSITIKSVTRMKPDQFAQRKMKFERAFGSVEVIPSFQSGANRVWSGLRRSNRLSAMSKCRPEREKYSKKYGHSYLETNEPCIGFHQIATSPVSHSRSLASSNAPKIALCLQMQDI